METEFTPMLSTGGGILIGCAAVLTMLILGRIMGASGLLFGLINARETSDRNWRGAMILGMIAAPVLWGVFTGSGINVTIETHPLLIALGGVIVGFGTSLGSGCTSGHGVCGLSRLSLRSAVAVPVFMVSAAVTVFIIRHVFGG